MGIQNFAYSASLLKKWTSILGAEVWASFIDLIDFREVNPIVPSPGMITNDVLKMYAWHAFWIISAYSIIISWKVIILGRSLSKVQTAYSITTQKMRDVFSEVWTSSLRHDSGGWNGMDRMNSQWNASYACTIANFNKVCESSLKFAEV